MKFRLFSILFLILNGIQSVFSQQITVKNPCSTDRNNESVVISWKDMLGIFPDIEKKNVEIIDSKGNRIVKQILRNENGDKEALLFQVDIPAKKERCFTIKIQPIPIEDSNSKVYGRYVPERLDDFAWENNCIAYRMYGPALEQSGEISNGIDVWVKRTEKFILNKWYKKGYNYHTDTGEGLDMYQVGRSLGAGGMAPYDKDSLYLSKNWISYKIIDNGPIRFRFKLEYAPYMAGKQLLTQSRIISLDANQNLNTITEKFTGNFDSLDVAAGIILRNNSNNRIDFSDQYIACSEVADTTNGKIYIAVITNDKGNVIKKFRHLLKTTKIKNGTAYTYHAGAYWSKFNVKNDESWKKIIKNEIVKINNPLIVKLKKNS